MRKMCIRDRCGSDHENAKLAAQDCRAVYEAGFSPICPTLYQPLFLNDAVPEDVYKRQACVFFMKKSLSDRVQRSLTGFAAGVMVAASVWSLSLIHISHSRRRP